MTTKRLLHRVLVPLGLICFGLTPSISRADITFYDSFGSFNTALGSINVDNILFNQGLPTTGTTVEGATQAGVILQFTSPTDLLVNMGSGGQAKINPASPATTFNTLTILPVNTPNPPNTGTLQAISWNTQTLNVTGTLTVTVQAENLATNTLETVTHTVQNSNGNFETGVIASTNPLEAILSVKVVADQATGGMVAIQNVGEFRVATGPSTVVPEPTTMAIALSGLGTLGLVALRRRRSPAGR
jgi:hypothetical protein